MNSDEIMSDPAGPPNPTAEPGPKSSTWNNKKFRDDYNSYKSRLQHQKFSSAEYPDPLAPRPPHPLRYPQGTGPEVEEKLKKLIADIKAGNSGGVSA